ncbi:MAG: hypothetical protein OHK0052_16960 [Anaerolineales bacterium]
MTPQTLPRNLGDGLILRRATPADADALADFNSRVHSDEGFENPNRFIGAWTRDLLTKAHPTVQPADFTIVEDTATGKIVSSMNLISQTWTYAGIPFGVGRPELVGTLPEYRKRGLVRAQFDAAHAWSAARGELAQAITGIPYYYRQFGYEMTVNLGGGRSGALGRVPALPEGEQEPFGVRPATVQDLPFIAQTYDDFNRRYLLACARDEALWQWELDGHSPESINGRALAIITNLEGAPVGFLAYARQLWGGSIALTFCALNPGLSWFAPLHSILRFLRRAADEVAQSTGESGRGSFFLALGEVHPLYEALHGELTELQPPYRWYMRVPDLPAFLLHIRPVLEARLANSIVAGFDGALRMTFYRSGLRMVFERGKLTGVEPWQPEPMGHSGDAAFPDQTFLHLLFGQHSRDALRAFLPDTWANGALYRALLNALFPPQSSNLFPVS